MTGRELRELFQSAGIGYQDVAKGFGVLERTVFAWYAKEDVPPMLEWAARWVCEEKRLTTRARSL